MKLFGLEIGGKSGGKTKNQKAVNPTLAKMFPSLFKNKVTSDEIDVEKLIKQEAPKLPRVNILPPSLIIEIQKRKMKRTIGIAFMSTIGLIVGVWFYQGIAINEATSRLQTAEQASEQTLADKNRLAAVGEYYNGLQDRITIVTDAYAEQANYTEILRGIYMAAPVGVDIDQIALEYIPSTSANPPLCGVDAQPFAEAQERALGCITFAGTAASTEAFGQFVKNLERVPGITAPFVAPGNTAADGSRLTFSGTAAITKQASFAPVAEKMFDVSEIAGIVIVLPEALGTQPVDNGEATTTDPNMTDSTVPADTMGTTEEGVTE